MKRTRSGGSVFVYMAYGIAVANTIIFIEAVVHALIHPMLSPGLAKASVYTNLFAGPVSILTLYTCRQKKLLRSAMPYLAFLALQSLAILWAAYWVFVANSHDMS